jgi:hypothetical protein
MTNEEKVRYWVQLFDYDMETAAVCMKIITQTKSLQQWTKETLLLTK